MKDLIWTSLHFGLDKGKVWFVPYWHNLLCCYSLETHMLERIEVIPDENDASLLFDNMVIIGEEIILIPANSTYVFFYNMESRVFSKITLPEQVTGYNKFCACGIWKKNLFLFPGRYPMIMKINLETRESAYITDWSSKIETEGEITCFQFNYLVLNEKVYLVSSLTNKIMIYDMEKESEEIIELGDKTDIFSTITYLENDTFLLTDEKGNCNIADFKNRAMTKYENDIPEFVTHRFEARRACFSDALKYREFVYVFPAQANKVFKFSLIDHSFKEMCWENEYEAKRWDGERYSLFQRDKDVIYGFDALKGVLLEIDLEHEKVCCEPISLENIDDSKIFNIIEDKHKRQAVIRETSESYMGLRNLMMYIQAENSALDYSQKSSVGKTIYQEIAD